jgi:hypothetical protein
MTNPFITTNPQEFKLRIVWGIETGRKLVAEFCNSIWLPRVGEIMILPIDSSDANNRCRNWYQFKVANIIYDFENQVVRVVCAAITPIKTTASAPVFDQQARSPSDRGFVPTDFALEEVDEELNGLRKRLELL